MKEREKVQYEKKSYRNLLKIVLKADKDEVEFIVDFIKKYKLKNKSREKRLRKTLNKTFLTACCHVKLDIIKYLLKENQFSIDISQKNDYAIREVCVKSLGYDTLETITFLTSQTELDNPANIHAQNDSCFKILCENSAISVRDMPNNMQVISHLIFDKEIEQTLEIKKIVQLYPEIQAMFEKRDLRHKLEKDLTPSLFKNISKI